MRHETTAAQPDLPSLPARGGTVSLVLGEILGSILFGFVIGAAARWAVPGPDPMPFWLTVMIGFGGSIIGGGIVAAALGANKNVSSSDYFSVVIASILASILLVIAYRRFVQKRPITGPEAHEPPTRGIGIDRMRGGSFAQRVDQTAADRRRADLLQKIDDLHEAGLLTDEEYAEKRAQALRST
jgi:uncharacterized membrane protein YeaQ/YmgE (transglycosylase-associated protein family)